MLKFIFLILVLVNGGLFAYHQGHLDGLLPVGREPARLAQQMNADKIRLLPAQPATPQPPAPAPADKPAASPVADPAATVAPVAPVAPAAQAAPAEALAVPASATPSASAAALSAATTTDVATAKPEDAGKKAEGERQADAGKKPEVLACLEVGNFNDVDAGRVESTLAKLAPGARLSRRAIREVSSHMVMMPPQGSKENADRKVSQLRGLGVSDFYVIQDQSELRWGISLGIFSTEEAAGKRLDQLKQQGVRTARIVARNAVSKVAFQLRELDAAGRARLDGLKADFPQHQQRKCA